MNPFLLGSIAAVIVLDAYASFVVVRAEPELERRRLQIVFTWLVPIVGAGLVLFAHRPATTTRDPELDYERPLRDAVDTPGSGGAHVDAD